MNRAGYWVTLHAAEQMRDRNILLREMRAALADPDQTYPTLQNPHASHRRMVQGGRLGVVVDDIAQEVVTVVFRYSEDWAEHLRAQAVVL